MQRVEICLDEACLNERDFVFQVPLARALQHGDCIQLHCDWFRCFLTVQYMHAGTLHASLAVVCPCEFPNYDKDQP